MVLMELIQGSGKIIEGFKTNVRQVAVINPIAFCIFKYASN